MKVGSKCYQGVGSKWLVMDAWLQGGRVAVSVSEPKSHYGGLAEGNKPTRVST